MITLADAYAHLGELAKPHRSLGRLEHVAARLAVIQQSLAPQTKPRLITLFAGDHGVVESGVSAWPSAITTAMMATIVAGRASSSALANAARCALQLVDMGSITPLRGQLPAFFSDRRIAAGTANLALGPAMSVLAFDQAWTVGSEVAQAAINDGYHVMIAGEMGIGNTTSAACLTMLLAQTGAAAATGTGAGADEATRARKQAIVESAVRHAQQFVASDTRAAIAALSGFEIAAMAGYFATAAQAGKTILLDGYVATAAALIAERFVPGTASQMIAAHLSAEPGHRAALNALNLEPMLEWDMCLGEGTGALIALPLLDAAAALLADVATLAEIAP